MPILNADYSTLSYDEMAASIGLKPKHMPMLIGSFVEESQSIVGLLETAISSNDYESVKLHAHSIKGSAGNLKFTAIYEMAKEMEHAGADSDGEFDYTGYLEAIKQVMATIKS